MALASFVNFWSLKWSSVIPVAYRYEYIVLQTTTNVHLLNHLNDNVLMCFKKKLVQSCTFSAVLYLFFLFSCPSKICYRIQNGCLPPENGEQRGPSLLQLQAHWPCHLIPDPERRGMTAPLLSPSLTPSVCKAPLRWDMQGEGEATVLGGETWH